MPIVNYQQELRTAYLRAAINAQSEEENRIARNRKFYAGEQGVELTDRQREYLGDISNDLTKQAFANICASTVQIPQERLAVLGIEQAAGETSTDYADAVTGWWRALRLDIKQSDLYEAALRDGQAAIIVGWDGEKPTYTSNILYDGETGQVRLHYNDDTGALMYASKRWRAWDEQTQSATGPVRLTLYFADKIIRFEDDAKAQNGWRMLEAAELGGLPNPQPWVDGQGRPLGLPVIPFDNPGGSELDDVLMPQKAINKTLADLLSSIDMHGFPFLWMSGISLPVGSDGNPQKPKFGPGEALVTSNPAGRFGRIEPANLQMLFDAGALSWVQIAALIKRWPVHLFNRTMEPPSGEALKQMEASLIAQIEHKQRVFGDAWRDAFDLGARLMLRYRGMKLEGELAFRWKPPAVRDELAQQQRLSLKWKDAEVPIEQRWHEAGYTQDEIDRMNEMAAQASARIAEASVRSALRIQQGASSGH